MKAGVRAHDYGKRSIEEMAALLHDEGYLAAQLVLPKAFMEIDSYESITSKHLEKNLIKMEWISLYLAAIWIWETLIKVFGIML